MPGIGPLTDWKCLEDEGEAVLQILGLFQIKLGWFVFFNENWENLVENFNSENGSVVGIGLLMSCELD